MNKIIFGFYLREVCFKFSLFFLFIILLQGSTYAQGPTITYTPLSNVCNSSARVLTATISDVDGILTTTTNKPLLYYRVSSGPYTAVNGVQLAGDDWKFTFGAGFVAGQIISYFVVAADNLGNTSVYPSAGASASINGLQINVPPTNPDYYFVQNALAPGTYKVGSAGPPATDFVTLTDAVNAYNNSCLSGPVVFDLVDYYTTPSGLGGTGTIYGPNEVFPIVIHNPQASAVNKLTIRAFDTSLGQSLRKYVVIRGNSNEAIFKFNAADYVTISGQKSLGTNIPTTPYFYVYNESENPQSTVMWIANQGMDPATNNTIQYCGLIGNGADKTYGAIISSSGNLPGQTAEVANSNNTYKNNIISKAYYGIGIFGATTNDINTTISRNIIGSATVTDKLGYRGISLLNQKDVLVDSNVVFGIQAATSTSEPTAGIAVYGNCVNGKISRNSVSDIKNIIEPVSSPVYGIGVYSETVNSGLRIQNNFVYTIAGYGNVTVPANNAHGIAILSGTGYKVYHNTVHMVTAQTLSSGGITSCLFLGPAFTVSTSIDVRNNIFSQQASKGGRYSVYVSTPSPIMFAFIDYNDYFSKQSVGFMGGARNTLAEWQESTGSDLNSLAVDPKVTSAVNLHLRNDSPLESRGLAGLGVLVDIDNETRPPVKPDMGADEITPPPCNDNQGGTIVSNRKDVCFSGQVILSATGFSTGGGIVYQWESSLNGSTFTNLGLEINPNMVYSPSISNNTYYRLRVTCSGGSPGYSNVIYMPVLKPSVASVTPNANRCGSGTVTLTASGAPAADNPVIKWYDVPTNGATLTTGTSFVTPVINATTNFYAETQIGGSAGVVGPKNPAAVSTDVIVSSSSIKLFFDVLAPTTLVSLDMFPGLIGERAEIGIYTATGVKLISVPFNTAVQGKTTPQTIFINLPLDVGQGYYIAEATSGQFANGGFYLNKTGANYPYNSSDIRITGNEYSPGYYVNYYNIKFSSACASPRKVVPVVINPPPAITVTAALDSICAGSTTTLNVTSANTNYIYKWTPVNLVGNTISVSPLTTTTYNVTANDAVCGTSGYVKVNIKAMPETVFSPVTNTKCFEEPAVKLDASGGVIRGNIILIEDFNNGVQKPTGWVTAPTSAVGWNILPAGSSLFRTIINSPDNTPYFGINGDVPSAINSFARMPKLNFTPYTAINMTFYYSYLKLGDFFDVQVSTLASPSGTFTGVDWVTVWNGVNRYPPFVKATVDLSAYAGMPNVWVRFRYKTQNGFYVALDNLLITGNDIAPTYTWTPTTGLFTDLAGTIPYTGGPASTVYASPDTTKTYIVSSTGVNGCSASSNSIVKIRETGGAISGDNTICGGGSSNLTVIFSGTRPWNFTYTDGVNPPVTLSNITDSIYTFPVTPTVASVYTLTAVSDANCSARPSKLTGSATINFTSPGISSWVGTNSNWFDQTNWCGFVPDATTKVIIPTGAAAYPVIDAPADVKEISIATNAKITIGSTGALSVKEIFANNGILQNNGTITLDGNALQVFPTGTGTITAMNVLDLNNSTGVTINKKMRITGMLKPRAGTITITDTLFISSTLDSTASITRAGATTQFVYSGLGKFTVERFIPDHRKAWQLLSAGTFGQSVRDAWMEGATFPLQNLKPGYGTITTSELPSALVNGFDFYTRLGSTVKIYNPATNNYDGIVSTITAPVSQPNGYLIYVRGDRSVTDAATPANDVILRSTGKIYSPTNPAPDVPVGALKFTSVGNPYACAIDFASLRSTSTGVDAKYYVWDPILRGSSGNGGYQTISSTNGYKPVPGSIKYPANIPVTSIQSGQAIIVYSTPGGTVRFSENNKIEGSQMVFRPAEIPDRSFLRGSLKYNSEIMDGNVIAFDENFSNSFDNDDARKLAISTQSFAIKSSGEILTVEARKHVIQTDTVFYEISHMQAGNYQFAFEPENMDPLTRAWLVDNFTHTTSEVSTSAITNYLFNVNNVAASSAANRFYIIFKPQRPLPVTILNVDAIKQDKFVRVEWKVTDEINIDHYEVLKSSTGINFDVIGRKISVGTSGIINYNLIDEQPFAGDNFYRIKSVGIGGDVKLSNIVRVNFSIPYVINVYPNPVVNNYFNVRLSNVSSGKLKLSLINSAGQKVYVQDYDHNGNTEILRVNPSRFIAAGIYKLIIEGDRVREVINVSFGY